MTRRAFTPEQDILLTVEYEAGSTFRELAAKYGASDVAIRNAVLRGGGTPRVGRRKSHWSSECEDEAVRLYLDGMSVRKVSMHFAVRTDVISELLARHGVSLHPGGKVHPRLRTMESCRDIADMYSKGASLSELARVYECSTPTVTKAIRRGGGEIRHGGRSITWTSEVVAWAIVEYSNGRSQQEIAEDLGVSQVSVSRRLQMSGICMKPRPSGENHGSWKGGRHFRSGGYIMVRPTEEDIISGVASLNCSGYMPEHRLAMARDLGRPLLPHPAETVHHKDGNPSNNDLSNLQLRQGNHGIGAVFKCNTCGSHDVSAVDIADAA